MSKSIGIFSEKSNMKILFEGYEQSSSSSFNFDEFESVNSPGFSKSPFA